MRRFGFVYNPRAGHGGHGAIVRAAGEKLRSGGHEALAYEFPGDPSAVVAEALRDGCEVVVACGGDGTVSAVASAILSSKALLGILPLGTFNHFAKDLGIADLAAAQRALAEGCERRTDAGLLNGRAFFNNSGIGIYPAIVIEREKVRQRGVPKWPAFALASIRALARLPFLRLHLEADGRHLARITPFLFVGNNVYEIEGRTIGTRKRMDEGLLGVCAARHPGPLGLMKIAGRAIAGRLRENRDFTVLAAHQLTVRTKRVSELDVSLDGELHRMRSPLCYSIAPRALRVLAP